MNHEAMMSAIREVALFKSLDLEEQGQIAELMEVRALDEGDYLFEEGNPRKALYVIQDGEIELSKDDTFGGVRRIVVFHSHDFLGEGALLDDSAHSTSARALKKTVVLIIRREAFASLFQRDPDIASKVLSRILRVITRRMQQTTMGKVREAAQYVSGRTRHEHDLLGDREVPHEAYYGIQTLRGIENFFITGIPLAHYPALIEAFATIKMAAAKANAELGLIPKPVADAIVGTGQEILAGRWHNQFMLDVIQGGAGTSTNMNANEVMANRALELMGHERGDYEYCHPNNHVNCSQSTNDAYPSALKLAMFASNQELVDALEQLVASFREKGQAFAHILKMGRTQLQDAVPMTLGQAFEAYAVSLSDDIAVLNQNAALLLELNMGGTAIGTGLNAAPEFGERCVMHLREISGLDVRLSPNLIEETQGTGAFLMYSAALKHLAVKLSKICNDLRLLSSGPRAGFFEINLPKMQPGSSIMPGKVNPVIPEVVNQVAFKVIGNDLAVTLAAEAGQLELNVMEPVIGACVFESVEMLRNAINTFKHRCVDGITANEDRCRDYVRNSIGLVTALNPVLGYEVSTQLAKEALETNRGIYELVLEKQLLSQSELDRILAPENMLKPQVQAKL